MFSLNRTFSYRHCTFHIYGHLLDKEHWIFYLGIFTFSLFHYLPRNNVLLQFYKSKSRFINKGKKTITLLDFLLWYWHLSVLTWRGKWVEMTILKWCFNPQDSKHAGLDLDHSSHTRKFKLWCKYYQSKSQDPNPTPNLFYLLNLIKLLYIDFTADGT